MPPINAASVNRRLRLRQSLKNLRGAAKKNDIFTIQSCSLGNLLQLLWHGDVYGAYYLTSFVLWSAAISISDLHSSLRLDLLGISFTVVQDWFDIVNMETGPIPYGKCFTETVDVIRCLSVILFQREAPSNFPEIALNRLVTHPVENRFGLMRVAANSNHTGVKCKGALVKATLMNKILCAHNLKSHVRRHFTIAGLKVLDSVNQGLFFIHGLGDRGVSCTEQMLAFVMDSASTTQPDALAWCREDLAALSE
jgi:hypothetical protein